jgi:hypothetical protein
VFAEFAGDLMRKYEARVRRAAEPAARQARIQAKAR